MSPWVTVATAGGLLVVVVAYAIAHLVPGRYRMPEPARLADLGDGVYVVLKPG